MGDVTVDLPVRIDAVWTPTDLECTSDSGSSSAHPERSRPSEAVVTPDSVDILDTVDVPGAESEWTLTGIPCGPAASCWVWASRLIARGRTPSSRRSTPTVPRVSGQVNDPSQSQIGLENDHGSLLGATDGLPLYDSLGTEWFLDAPPGAVGRQLVLAVNDMYSSDNTAHSRSPCRDQHTVPLRPADAGVERGGPEPLWQATSSVLPLMDRPQAAAILPSGGPSVRRRSQ